MSPIRPDEPVGDWRDPNSTSLRCFREEYRGPMGSIVMIGWRSENVAGSRDSFAAQPLTFEKVAPGGQAQLITSLSSHDAQTLMDSLYSCGVRPSEAAGSAGAMAAVTRHLNDLRAIVEKKLGVKLP